MLVVLKTGKTVEAGSPWLKPAKEIEERISGRTRFLRYAPFRRGDEMSMFMIG
jgi:hypothetical protein